MTIIGSKVHSDTYKNERINLNQMKLNMTICKLKDKRRKTYIIYIPLSSVQYEKHFNIY